mmetsp:Transcript_1505/g.2829  ORF Transcript_1505/g.2829 Transcript_1505/m.2829 type:complete len:197 (+) Transcript_1505:94-684(+)
MTSKTLTLLVSALAVGCGFTLPTLGMHTQNIAIHATSMLTAGQVDPFADPMFGAASEVQQAASQGDPIRTLITGAIVYGVSMIALSYWEDHILPDLQERGIMPRITKGYEEKARMLKSEKLLPWLTPLTADQSVPLPVYADLEKSCHHVGRNGDVHQYICAAENYKPDKLIDCQISKEFSELYGKPVLICKRKDPY